jgi:hypothetical protein
VQPLRCCGYRKFHILPRHCYRTKNSQRESQLHRHAGWNFHNVARKPFLRAIT